MLALIGGDSGIGKTRLLETFLAGQDPEAVAQGRCHEAEGTLAYAPVAEILRSKTLKRALAGLEEVWLAELARLLPERRREYPRLPPPGPLQGAWGRLHLFEALARAVLARQPRLLAVDDLQWCDHDSLEWLH